MTAALLLPFLLLTQDKPAQLTITSPGNAHVTVTRAGHLMVLGSTERGQAMVLYPRRPGDDSRVPAGATVALKSRRPAAIVAVWSDQPFNPTGFAANTFWSVDSLESIGDAKLPSTLVALATRMSPPDAELVTDAARYPPAELARVRFDRARALWDPSSLHRDFAYLSPITSKNAVASPPAVCNGNVCALPVLGQLGGLYRRF